MCYSRSIVRLMAAEATRTLLAPLGIQRILLVTSAFPLGKGRVRDRPWV